MFGYEELLFGRHRLQLGGRGERDDYMAAARASVYRDEHGHDDDHDDDDGADHLEPPDLRDWQFLGASASVAKIGDDRAFVASFSTSSASALQELYNLGPQVGNFEVGGPDRELETTLELDFSFRHQSDRVGSDLNFQICRRVPRQRRPAGSVAPEPRGVHRASTAAGPRRPP